MPVPSLASFKVTAGEVSSATKFNNLVQAVEDELGSIQADQIPGGGTVGQFLRGDGWAGAFSTYTPTWLGTGTNPAIGNGTLTGRYLQIGKLIIGHARILMGSTTTFGSAGWIVGLPVAAALANPLAFFVLLRDASVGEFKGLARPNTVNDVVIFHGGEGAAANLVSATVPFPWVATDELVMNFMYEAA